MSRDEIKFHDEDDDNDVEKVCDYFVDYDYANDGFWLGTYNRHFLKFIKLKNT